MWLFAMAVALLVVACSSESASGAGDAADARSSAATPSSTADSSTTSTAPGEPFDLASLTGECGEHLRAGVEHAEELVDRIETAAITGSSPEEAVVNLRSGALDVSRDIWEARGRCIEFTRQCPDASAELFGYLTNAAAQADTIALIMSGSVVGEGLTAENPGSPSLPVTLTCPS